MSRKLVGLFVLSAMTLFSGAAYAGVDDEWEDVDGPQKWLELDGPLKRILPQSLDEPALTQWGMGPFEVRDPSILGELRAAPMARSPRTLNPFEFEVGVRQTQESTYVYADASSPSGYDDGQHRLTVDGETRDTHLVFRMGVLPRIELGAELDALHYQGGGFLDGLIRSFHETIGQGSGALRRNMVRAHSYIVEGTQGDGRTISFPYTGTGIGDAVLSPRVLLLRGSDYYPAISLTLSLWIPTASPKFEHAHGTAETFSVDGSKRLGSLPLVIYFGGAYTYYAQTDVHGLELIRNRFMVYGGFEWELTRWISLVTHYWQETKRETKLYSGTDIANGNSIRYIASGVKFAPFPGVRIEVGALESFDKSAGGDFGFIANLWVAFGSGGVPEGMGHSLAE